MPSTFDRPFAGESRCPKCGGHGDSFNVCYFCESCQSQHLKKTESAKPMTEPITDNLMNLQQDINAIQEQLNNIAATQKHLLSLLASDSQKCDDGLQKCDDQPIMTFPRDFLNECCPKVAEARQWAKTFGSNETDFTGFAECAMVKSTYGMICENCKTCVYRTSQHYKTLAQYYNTWTTDEIDMSI